MLMMVMKKIIILLCLTAISLGPVQARMSKDCTQQIEHSIVHLEVLTNAYNHGEIDFEVYIELVEKVDQDVEQKLIECQSRHKKMLGLLADTFGEQSALYEFITNLSSTYKKAREELLNGTERVD
jgi:hypothetical protein